MTHYDKNHDLFTITCDAKNCYVEREYEASDWHEGHAEAKKNGWITRTVDAEWKNFCSIVCFFNATKPTST